MVESSHNAEQCDTEEKSEGIQTSKSNALMKASPDDARAKPLAPSPSKRYTVKEKYLFPVLYVLSIFVVAGVSFYLGGLQAQKSNKADAAPQMIVETLWATPLARTHLRTHPNTVNLTEFNAKLAGAVAKDYAVFRGNHSELDGSDVNDLFFQHQVGATGETKKEIRTRVDELEHRRLAEFDIVARCAANLADRLLQRFGEAAVDASRKRLEGWATFHDSSSRHVLHVHTQSTLSIVYYVQMGRGAQLRLYDPRGPRPPFEGSIEVWPEAGEMIGFPGWLAHEVETGNGERVSLVFNVPGRWEGDEFGGETVSLGRWGKVKGWKLEFADGKL